MTEELQAGDSDLARAAQGGDLDAFEVLLSRYEMRLLSFIRQMTRNAHDAEDISQTVWVTVYRQLHRFDPSRTFSTWLFTIARNAAISEWRKRKNDCAELQEHDWVDRTHPSEPGCRREDTENIWAWVGENLSKEQRDALWLMYREEMSVRDIARTLDCSVVRVKVMLHRARKKLLRSFTDQTASGVAATAGLI